jgi:hypothetical protein
VPDEVRTSASLILLTPVNLAPYGDVAWMSGGGVKEYRSAGKPRDDVWIRMEISR